MQMKNLPIILLFVILFGCASHRKIVEKENEDKDDLKFLINLAEKSNAKNNVLNEQEISKMITTFDSLCEKGIQVFQGDSLEDVVKQVDQVFILDGFVEKQVDNARDHRLALSYNELKFHLLVKTQAQMQEAYKNFEEHQGFVFDTQISETLPLIQINQKFSEIKTNIIKDLISTLSFLDSNVEKQRCWIAIDRMLNEIDVKKSEFGYKPFQRSSAGIFTKKGEIITLLQTYYHRLRSLPIPPTDDFTTS